MAGATTAVSTAPNHPSIIQTPPARQQLGEDLFRLVQVRLLRLKVNIGTQLSPMIDSYLKCFYSLLQHINYMGMMEVLGASFSSLQLAQQSSTLAQSNLNASHPHVPPSHVTNYIPQPNALPDQTTISVAPQTQSTSASNNPQPSQATACMFADRPALQIAGKTSLTDGHPQITRNLSSAASGAGVNDQVWSKCIVKF